jgi:hypothetical protein
MILCDASKFPQLQALLGRYALRVESVPLSAPIPGSHWGEPEAGLVGDTLYVRADTPLHSALHEAAHFVCMDNARRAHLHTDAGGDYEEENGVCYLQIVFARHLGVAARDACADMDAWGYSFRLGSAYAWYTQDADDARKWLLHHGLLTAENIPTWRRRETASF